MLLELINSLVLCYVRYPSSRPPNCNLAHATSSPNPPPSPSLAKVLTEFLLSAPPPNRRSETLRLLLFLTSPIIRPVIVAQLLCNFVFSDLVASLLGLSYQLTAAAAAAAASAAASSTGSIGAAFTLATGIYNTVEP